MNKLLFLCSLMLITWGHFYAQDKNNNIVDISLTSVPDTVNKNYFIVFININIKDGWHLNSNKPLDEYMTPTSITLKNSSGIRLVNIEYPPEINAKLQFSDSELSLYEGMVTIKVILKADESYLKDKKKAEFELEYQSCNNQTCLFPVQKFLSVNL
jgi:DsbC/DsbD-like thiol-disulfide interchange protein